MSAARRPRFRSGRQRGRHAVMQKRTAGTTVTVPVPLHDEICIGTLQSIIRPSGLLKSLFEQG
ncbi:type II toxin-antitoxin system HicA family toxin [Candidatus Accumulibacter vicinus]|uniref:type II toxin-antitoxin system HicA family toxin n=1 Tax=Candidatus Accumulibacter vicinus TaxID=2954382 RepID=UPI0030811489